MRLKQAPAAWNQLSSNGNTTLHRWSNVDHRSLNRYEHNDNFTQSHTTIGTDNFHFRVFNVADENNPTAAGYNDFSESSEQTTLDNLINSFGDEKVCNRQYRESIKEVDIIKNTYTNKVTLEGNDAPKSEHNEVAFAYNSITPNDDDERMLEQSDTDESSDCVNARCARTRVPRGIVNPNYPGFQHLAHTLQDYSKTIENFYQSENEMTDDDLDAEVIDSGYDAKDEEFIQYEPKSVDSNFSNNNNVCDSDEYFTESKPVFDKSNLNLKEDKLEILVNHANPNNVNNESPMHEMPDLLKNVTISTSVINNNANLLEPEQSIRLDTDIENNFAATNIIGDFNKEVEEEINNIFKYNLNFQDDLQELRKDIEIAFKKPIEDTINHISEVVNQVIKQLVTGQDEAQHCKFKNIYNSQENVEHRNKETSDEIQIFKENETNIKKEMKQNRPTFLFIENNINSTTLDAFLSDAKDELNFIEDFDKSINNTSDESLIQKLAPNYPDGPIFLQTEQNIELAASSAQVNTFDETPINIDNNSNEITGKCANSDVGKSAEDSGHNYVTSKEDKAPTKVLNKEELSKGAKEKDIDTSNAFENISTIKLSNRLRWERRSNGASTSGARQRETAQGKISVQNKDKNDEKLFGSFDVYNIETAMPKLDLDAIESHLKAAKEAERRKRNDREEIRRRLAMGVEAEELTRSGRKPSLHSRLQSGRNLQICFMNETLSDNESQNSDSERSPSAGGGGGPSSYMFNHPYQTRPLSTSIRNEKTASGAKVRPNTLSLKTSKSRSSQSLGPVPLKEADFRTLQAALQTEARVALAQAKEIARVHMERERRCRSASPVTEMLRRSLDKAHAPLAADRRRVSRHLLTDMNVAQLQVIVNSLHGEVEQLSEALVRLLMARDELHMGQDSMLVDIEDLTRYLGVKEQGSKSKGPAGKSGVRRLAALVRK